MSYICPIIKFKTGSPGHSDKDNMATISSDLKHVLENVFYGGPEIKLTTPLKFKFDPKLNTGISEIDSFSEHQIKIIYKKVNSWKMCDEFGNEWTVSKLDLIWQSALYHNILSMKDKRVKPVTWDLTL